MGIPESAKRNETMRDVTVAIRNNMPVSMQVRAIVINAKRVGNKSKNFAYSKQGSILQTFYAQLLLA